VEGAHNRGTEYETQAALSDVVSSLALGDKERAVERAVNAGLWAHALVLASHMNRELYNGIVAKDGECTPAPGRAAAHPVLDLCWQV
jgi:hypothetical protein